MEQLVEDAYLPNPCRKNVISEITDLQGTNHNLWFGLQTLSFPHLLEFGSRQVPELSSFGENTFALVC